MLLQALFPARCTGCGTVADGLCSRCQVDLRPAPSAPPPPGVDWWVAPFAYEGSLREVLARAKYRNARSGLAWLASAVATSASRQAASGGRHLDTVTWPPTTDARRRQRGFDQAEHLARAIARRLDLPARPLLARRPGPPQTGRSRADRHRGPIFVSRPVAGAHLLLVDDVATTGATLGSAAAALREAGAASVTAATVARTPRRQPPCPVCPKSAQASGRARRYQG